MTNEGSLISFAADNDRDATIYSAISANIWGTYRKTNTETYSNLQYQILHCDVNQYNVYQVNLNRSLTAFFPFKNRMVLCLLHVLEPCFCV